MKFSIGPIHSSIVRSRLSAALATGALAIFGTLAHAAELDPITVSSPVVKIIGHDDLTRAPIESVTVKAQIAADAETLRNDSGIVLLKDRVREAAFKACSRAEPLTSADEDCIRTAVRAAKPQIASAIADAKAQQANAQERQHG